MGADLDKSKLFDMIAELSKIAANQAEVLDYLKTENEELQSVNQSLRKTVDGLKKEIDGLAYTE